ncbi:peptidase S8/S53 domain-containing protein [Mycena pura]|uniref:Peptidase S8/S53 domain-containing protein n=1 Tax=Mycena pura TaxID=153505 RepID=A0AAD6Y9D4_9AGAR|nr:peptidase S8/S53 domain-containing protein [Mycena pura]
MGPPRPDDPPLRATTMDWSYPYDTTWGEGVLVYVVDSGVRSTHQEVAGRVEAGYVIARLRTQDPKATVDYCDHGTGVASLIAGNSLGLARKATIVPVRVANADSCSRVASTTTDVVEAVNWAVSNYKTRLNEVVTPKAGIINISWQVYQTPESQKAFEAAIKAGMHITVSAGNNDKNQCFGGPSPAIDQRVKDVGQSIVGWMDWTEQRSDGSNFGPCLTLFAPGESITTAAFNSDTAYTRGGDENSGTSLSTPLVAGTIASIVTKDGNKSPAEMRTLLLGYAVRNAGLKNLAGSPDILLQSLTQSVKPQSRVSSIKSYFYTVLLFFCDGW